MDISLTIAELDRLIKKAEKGYGNALGKVLSGGIGDTEAISRLASINAEYNALLKLKEHLTPKPEPAPEEVIQQEVVPVGYTSMEYSEGDTMPPEGICSSEDCEDEFCVAYWEAVEGKA